ncbi:hypothetical protein PaecuDRAFT_2377 [Paenibacillus curdlanolyticus YK9]|uniref:Lipoprotein n=1 Tax=Paenibacillus curdlanolyticus YK9 TaxID=717606 RepID=E0I9P0_9BACL|nr:hypothetical protein [Paenibacillus curdlanolyticus]EFM11124.1 hypothetical protein PaecuDRAFT_2377 [Paenibacillus curdlanolyticus YK9]
MFKSYLILISLLLIVFSLVGCGDNTTSSRNKASDGTTASSDNSHTAHSETAAPANPKPNKEMKYSLDASSYEEDGIYYLKVTTNLKLSSEHYEGAPVDGEGHIHFYLNGSLVGPIKDTVPYPLQALREGKNTIKLVLAENNHSESFGISKELSIDKK